jgi:DNA-binding SARP family transcriptional activator
VVKLCAFGEPSLFAADGTRLDGIVRHNKRFALLLYLACGQRNGPHRRDELIAIFWPEADDRRARNSLRQSLHVLKDRIGAGFVVACGEQELCVDQGRLQCDVKQFLLALDQGALDVALKLYSGDFLEGFFLSDSPEFGFWAEEWRIRLRELAVRAAKNLAHTAEGDRSLHDALYWWRRTLELAPFDEPVVRRIMALLAGSGNRCEALAALDRFRRRMEAELGVEPSEETTEFAHLVSTAPLDRIPVWVGDRRRGNPPNPGARWRRSGDGVSR